MARHTQEFPQFLGLDSRLNPHPSEPSYPLQGWRHTTWISQALIQERRGNLSEAPSAGHPDICNAGRIGVY